MSALLQTLLSRRSFVKSGTALTAILLASCNGDEAADDEQAEPSPTPVDEPIETPVEEPTPTPEPTATPEPTPTPTPEPAEPLSILIEDGLDPENNVLVQHVLAALEDVANDHDLAVEQVSEGAQATVQIRRPDNDNGDAVAIHGEPLIAVIRANQFVDSVLADDIPALFMRSIESWQELGGRDWMVHPAVSHSIAPPPFARAAQVHPHNDLVGLSNEHPGMIALVPRSAASFHIQTLMVDEVDPLRDELSLENWLWWDRVDVVVEHPDSAVTNAILEILDDVSAERHAGRRTMLSITGDVMLGRTPHRIMYESGDWIAPFPLVADELQKGDLTIGNLECAITDSFEPPADPSTFSFMTFTNAVEGLEYAGFHALSGANNHAMDFGIVGVRDTTAALEAAGIQHFGTGDNLDEAREPCLLEHDGVTFGFLGYDAISMHYAGATAEGGGVAPLVREYVIEDIHRTREVADVVIPYFHWGIEYTLTPTENDRQMAHAAVEAGADVVLGGHPHWVQGMEIYQGTPIFYSTSNFVFDQEWSFETKQGFVLHLIFDGTHLKGYRVVPVLIEDFHRPRVVDDEVRTTILGRFWESSSIIANTPIAQITVPSTA